MNAVSAPSFSVGQFLEFDYPAANYHVVGNIRWERRRILITRLRDVLVEPVELGIIQADPFLRRGRLLVTGFDCSKLAERSFYRESMNDIRVIKPFVALNSSSVVGVIEPRPLSVLKRGLDPATASAYVRATNRLKLPHESRCLMVPDAVAAAIEHQALAQWPPAPQQ